MKKLITTLMIMMLILTGCSNKNSSKENKKEETVQDKSNSIYGTYRTSGVSVKDQKFTLEQIIALAGDESYVNEIDMIFVFNENGILYVYSASYDRTEALTYTLAEDNSSITINDNELSIVDGEILFTNDDTTLYLSKVSDRQDKDIINELIEKDVKNVDESKQDAEETIVSEPEPEEPVEDEDDKISEDTIRPEVKEAIDSYEAFIDEYCEFMKKYSESDGTDLSILMDYAKFASKLEDYTTKMENMEDDLTDAEYWYYYDVLMRCNDKLLKAAY